METPLADISVEDPSQPFVGRWNQLVSTTNWEKGRIIHQWRETMEAAAALASEFSDEAWARRVGGVTGQHVGRLRRVYHRFGEQADAYPGLYWSHYQAALDWDDAEMWLEGALQSSWSVSQMRRTRWETLGQLPEDEPHDAEIVSSELDEDFEPATNEQPVVQTLSEVTAADGSAGQGFADSAEGSDSAPDEGQGASVYAANKDEEPAIDFVRPFENLAELPDDLADAFELFKLAILHHKADNWSEISREDILASLDALKELALTAE